MHSDPPCDSRSVKETKTTRIVSHRMIMRASKDLQKSEESVMRPIEVPNYPYASDAAEHEALLVY